ncbi:ribosome biogenesis protein [Candidatus Caldarchaeum subterraneum]|uniref:Ribosomal RNA small subunit methyltransferase Nep1 n=1 Tax=Caldiarchaeum subterraneum TaxID=311458 RepID=E6N653_CALS0|nr:ribosome biogenesis protein [Candidatus Caldarchaeum subterraneum]BAJ50641.1 ribosome biogenesis protein [Candidatus Caldarchaeum subterraneum]
MAEAALETVPPEIQGHPAVVKDAERRGKKPSQILLDRSYHHFAMKKLPDAEKRGRPDIVHFCLLEALGSPLNQANKLETYVATRGGLVIYVNPRVRLPRVYERFKGVVEKLFAEGEIRSETGETLLRCEKKSLKTLAESLNPSTKILLTERGEPVNARGFSAALAGHTRPLIMVGCFPHGDFTSETKSLADKTLAIHQTPLEAWTVISRVLCYIEQNLIPL